MKNTAARQLFFPELPRYFSGLPVQIYELTLQRALGDIFFHNTLIEISILHICGHARMVLRITTKDLPVEAQLD